jgi:hypothetical protein
MHLGSSVAPNSGALGCRTVVVKFCNTGAHDGDSHAVESLVFVAIRVVQPIADIFTATTFHLVGEFTLFTARLPRPTGVNLGRLLQITKSRHSVSQ